jgi:hypothetical protein
MAALQHRHPMTAAMLKSPIKEHHVLWYPRDSVMCESSYYTGFNVLETPYEHDSWVLIKIYIYFKHFLKICLVFNAA